MLLLSIVLMTLALLCYSVATWWDRNGPVLQGRRVLLVWAGLACDGTGTLLMFRMAGVKAGLDFHSAVGAFAFALMLANACWAVAARIDGRPRLVAAYNRASVVFWALWLIPYLSGLILKSGGR